MKLVSYLHQGQACYGLVQDGRVLDLGSRLPQRDIVSFIAAGAPAQAEAARLARSQPGEHDYEAVQLLPVVPDPGKIICIGINYEDHRVEAGRDKTEHPMVFARFPESQTAHRGPILRAPRVSTQLDYEAELLVVIGRRAPRYTPRAQALQHVFGYACYNEACHRDWQFHTRQLTPGKNFESTGASGPWIVTADEIPDPYDLDLLLTVNGEKRQVSNTRNLLVTLPQLIAKFSPTGYSAGDILTTGTVSGVAAFSADPAAWYLKPGDVIEAHIEKIGTLRNRVVGWQEAYGKPARAWEGF